MSKQKLELKFNDDDGLIFKAPLRCYLIKQENSNDYTILHEELSIRANGKTPNEAAVNFKEVFIALVNDVAYKSKYSPLTEKERKKLHIIESICTISRV